MHRMIIDGKLVTADRTSPSVNPATGQVLDHAPDASVADARAATAAARRAVDTTSWATDVAFRVRCLDHLHQALTEHQDALREPTVADVAVGEALTTSSDVDAVTFTGSTATGRRIMAAASATIKRVFLELGGKSALVVLDDADLAGPLGMATFATCSHAGQGCAITTRMVVPREQHDAIAAQVAAGLDRVTYGDPTDSANYMGPLISERQRDKVDGLVQRAVAAGATLVTGGKKVDPGDFYTPTLLTNR